MEDTAEVVIVGGGIVGLCLAHALAERGVRDILVLERGRAGAGATLKATGGFRLQFATPINVRLSLLALPFWQSLEQRFNTPAGFRQCGYLFLATTPAQVAQSERNVAMQQALGVPARLVTPAEAATLAPASSMAGVLAGTFCPWDAVFEMDAVVAGLVADVRRSGARLVEGVAVTGVTVAGGRVGGVTTTAGPVSTPVVVNAAASSVASAGSSATDAPVRSPPPITTPPPGFGRA